MVAAAVPPLRLVDGAAGDGCRRLCHAARLGGGARPSAASARARPLNAARFLVVEVIRVPNLNDNAFLPIRQCVKSQ